MPVLSQLSIFSVIPFFIITILTVVVSAAFSLVMLFYAIRMYILLPTLIMAEKI